MLLINRSTTLLLEKAMQQSSIKQSIKKLFLLEGAQMKIMMTLHFETIDF